MTKISKKQAYPIKKPVIRDYFVGTDSEDNLKTVNFDFESVAGLVASINGDSVISYTFSNNPNLGITEQDAGYFLSFNDETSFPLIAKLFVSNRSRSNSLMTSLFDFIKNNASNFSFKLRNAGDPNNIAYLSIDSVENHATYYTFNISLYKSNYVGELINGAVYIFDFVMKNENERAPYDVFKFVQKGFGNIDLTNNEIGDIFSGWSNDGTIRITEAKWLGGSLNDSGNFLPLVQTGID